MRLLNRISLSPVKHKNPKVVVEFLGAINSPLFSRGVDSPQMAQTG
jgi:hypothetical protein